MMSYTLTGSKELRAALKKVAAEKVERFRKEVYASALDIQKKAKENLKETWDTGNAANTLIVDRHYNGLSARIEAQAPYAAYIEFGTKPHFPPTDALEGWAKRHGMDSAWPICLAIAEHGTPAHPFLLPAYEAVIDAFLKRIKAALK